MATIPVQRVLAGVAVVAIGIAICFGIFLPIPPAPKTELPPSVFISLTPRIAPTLNSSDPVGDEWPMFRGAVNHTGVTGTTPLNGTGPFWSVNLGSSIDGSPTVSNGCVYVGGDNDVFYCLNASTGSQLWSKSLGSNVIDSCAPAIANGSVFIGDYLNGFPCNLYRLNASTGAQIWSVPFTNGIFSSPVIANNCVYIGNYDQKVYCLNASTGVQLWNYPTGGAVSSSPAFANGSIYVGSADDSLYCLNATSGVKIWSSPTTGGVTSSPAVANESVILGSNDGWVYSFNASTGVQLWKYNAASGYITSSPAVANGRVYFGSQFQGFFCLDTTTGTKIWSVTTGGYIYTSPAVANGSVYFGSGADHKIWCLNATSDALQWSYTTGNNFFYSSPAIANGSVFIGSDDDSLYCLPMQLLPTAPQNLRALWGNGQVNLTWQAPASSSHSQISNYLIYRGTTPGSETYLATVGNVLTYVDTSITNGQNYYYKVNATYGVWEGLPSAEVNTPVLTIASPNAGQLFGNSTPSFTTSVIEPQLSTAWYRVGASANNHTFSPGTPTAVDSVDWSAQANGTVVLYFWANDTLGDLGFANVSIFRDIVAPGITITSPTTGQLAGATAPLFTVSVIEGNLDKAWYSLDGGVTNTTCNQAGDFSAQWSAQPNGTVVVTFWANDSVHNTGMANMTIRKDIIVPTVSVNNPLPNQLCGAVAPAFSITSTPNGGSVFASAWYSLDFGLTNTTCGLIGDISFQWIGQRNGTVNVTFWSEDSVGNIGVSIILLQRDIIAPKITITSPLNSQSSSNPPQLTFTVVDANLDKVWYTVGNNPMKFFLTNESTEIDASVWAALPAGDVAITLYANDTLGNEASSIIIVTKQIQGLEVWVWILIAFIAVLAFAVIAIPTLLNKKKITARRFVSSAILTPPVAIPAGQAKNIVGSGNDQDLETPVETYAVPPVASIPLSDMSEDESEKADLGESGVFSFRGGRIVGPRFIYKVKVKNATDTTITDVGIQLVSYPRDCMRLVTEEIRHVSKIEPGGFRSLEFELQPQKDCVEGELISSVNYLDSRNELFTIHVKPFVLKSVCDLMEPLVIPEAAFDALVSQWATTQEVVTFKGEDSMSLAEDVPVILESKNFHPISHHVEEVGGSMNSVTKGIATGKYTKRRLAVTIRIDADAKTGDGSITCTGQAEDENMLVACLSELLAEFRKPLVRQVRKILKDRKGVANLEDLRAELQVELPTLADAVRQEPDFVFLHGGEQVATYAYMVDFLNAMRADYDTVPVSDLEAELRPAGKTMQGILQELIASGKLRASWIGASEIRFKTELHKVALRTLYTVVAFISGIVTIIIFLLNYLK